MAETRTFASLTPTLLARKGSARPAMRPQLAPLHQFREATARQIDDLGWNDMGSDTPEQEPESREADVVQISTGTAVPDQSPVERKPPEVLRQRAVIEASIAAPTSARRSALAEGRRAAFTLRLDSERHLRLRLAATVTNRSAQQIVTEALDRLLAEMPEVAALAGRVGKRR